jgi:hypothetical protein
MTRKSAAFLIASVLLAARGEPAIPRIHRPLAGVKTVTVSIQLDLKDPLPPILLAGDFQTLIVGRLRSLGVKVLTMAEVRRDAAHVPSLEVKVLLIRATDARSDVGIRYAFVVMGSATDHTLLDRGETPGPVELWSGSLLAICDRRTADQDVERAIGQLVEGFVSEWREDNRP